MASASYSEETLVSGGWSGFDVHLDGAPQNSNVSIAVMPVGPDFFSTMSIPLLVGRTFTPADFASATATNGAIKAADERSQTGGEAADTVSRVGAAPISVIINEVFAQRFFAKENPVGRHIGNAEHEDEPTKAPQPGYLIIGLAGNAKYADLRGELKPTMY